MCPDKANRVYGDQIDLVTWKSDFKLCRRDVMCEMNLLNNKKKEY